jgi:hypothetical protein
LTRSELPKHWVSALFKKFQARYGHKWMAAIDGIEELAVGEWARELSGLTGEAIRAGLDAWDGDWPPSAPEFARLCRDLVTGAPSAAEAWRIICNARGKPGSLQQRYQHPVVLAAATHPDCDAFAWSQLPERDGLARFAPLYQRMLDKLAAGEPFDWPQEKTAIEDRAGKAVTPAERAQAAYRRRKQMAKARAAVRGRKTDAIDDWQRVHGMRTYV